MGKTKIKDGKVYETDPIWGDKEVGVVKSGGLFNDEVVYHDIFRPNADIETDWSGTVKDIVSKDRLSEFIQGHREGTRIEPDTSLSLEDQRSYEWTQELGGPKVPKSSKATKAEVARVDSADSFTGSGSGYSGGGGSTTSVHRGRPPVASGGLTRSESRSGSSSALGDIILIVGAIFLIGALLSPSKRNQARDEKGRFISNKKQARAIGLEKPKIRWWSWSELKKLFTFDQMFDWPEHLKFMPKSFWRHVGETMSSFRLLIPLFIWAYFVIIPEDRPDFLVDGFWLWVSGLFLATWIYMASVIRAGIAEQAASKN